MSGKRGLRPRPIRLPSPLAQAVLLVIVTVAVVLLVVQFAVPRAHDLSASLAPAPSIMTGRK